MRAVLYIFEYDFLFSKMNNIHKPFIPLPQVSPFVHLFAKLFNPYVTQSDANPVCAVCSMCISGPWTWMSSTDLHLCIVLWLFLFFEMKSVMV